MEMLQTHCYATGTVTLLWKCHKLTVMQQQLLRYYGNATGCIGHATKETQHVTIRNRKYVTCTVYHQALLWQQ
jgi:hypothetical protein